MQQGHINSTRLHEPLAVAQKRGKKRHIAPLCEDPTRGFRLAPTTDRALQMVLMKTLIPPEHQWLVRLHVTTDVPGDFARSLLKASCPSTFAATETVWKGFNLKPFKVPQCGNRPRGFSLGIPPRHVASCKQSQRTDLLLSMRSPHARCAACAVSVRKWRPCRSRGFRGGNGNLVGGNPVGANPADGQVAGFPPFEVRCNDQSLHID